MEGRHSVNHFVNLLSINTFFKSALASWATESSYVARPRAASNSLIFSSSLVRRLTGYLLLPFPIKQPVGSWRYSRIQPLMRLEASECSLIISACVFSFDSISSQTLILNSRVKIRLANCIQSPLHGVYQTGSIMGGSFGGAVHLPLMWDTTLVNCYTNIPTIPPPTTSKYPWVLSSSNTARPPEPPSIKLNDLLPPLCIPPFRSLFCASPYPP